MKALVPLVYISYLALGILQIAAVIAGVKHWLGVGTFLAVILAMFVGPIPLLGTILGVVGAHYAWGWSWIMSFTLFFGFLVVIGVLAAATGAVGALSSKR